MLIVTPGDPNADSYASLVEFQDYLASYTLFSGVISVQAENALRMATRYLDGMPEAWTGTAASDTQALGWPRLGMLNRNGFSIDSAVVPTDLKRAECEWARIILEAGVGMEDAGASMADAGISSISAAGVSVSFKSKSQTEEKDPSWAKSDERAAQVPVSVLTLLVPSWLKDPRDSEYRNFMSEVI